MKMILIVDDEEDFHRVLRRMLEPEGYKVVSSLSAEEAVRLLEAAVPDLAILDWNLPGMTGLGFAKVLKQDPRFKKIPLIMYTVRESEKDQLDAYSHDIQFFLTKPVESVVLLAKIKQLLQ
ncbi:MAG: response regulator [Elusimicrobia bacterium]|nr:response regulator [Elusimicrobiota bacterium]